jgi:hypothetical protein
MDNEQLKSNLTSSKHWMRLLFMLLFAAILYVASVVMWILVAIQFLFSLITGEDNNSLRRFGHSLSTYIYDVLKFLCYSSEEKPFPFSDWPDLPAEQKAVEPVQASTTVIAPQKKLTDAPDNSVGN